jgi:hypothetical protein
MKSVKSWTDLFFSRMVAADRLIARRETGTLARVLRRLAVCISRPTSLEKGPEEL